MMHQGLSPTDAYRRIELDARIEGSDGIGLTRLCLEKTISELERAQLAHTRGNLRARNDALSRAASSIAALRGGIAVDNPLREPMTHLYGSAESAVRAAIYNYRDDVLERIRTDLTEVWNASTANR